MTISYRVRKQIVDYFAQRKSSQEIASMLNVSLDQMDGRLEASDNLYD